jgi:peptide/nickel transport system permease protein
VSQAAQKIVRMSPAERTLRPRLVAARRFRPRDLTLFAAAAVLLALTVVAIAAPLLAPHSPTEQDLVGRLAPPTWFHGAHPLGTDELGRDVLSRMLYGTRISIALGFGCTGISAIAGLILGLLAGMRPRWIGAVILRTIDAQLAFPFVVLAIAVVAVTGPRMSIVVFLLSWLGVAQFTRLVNGETLVAARNEYVLASRGLGASMARIAVRDILPNLVGPVLVLTAFNLAQVIIVESALSFLGVGVQPPTPSWGGMLSEGQQYLSTAPWIATTGGIALMLTVLAVNVLGIRARQALDPRSRA